MELQLYPALAARTEKPLPTDFERMVHASLGLLTEVGEIVTEVKRMAIYGKALDDIDPKTNLTRRQHIAEEIGDVLWYVAIAVNVIGINFPIIDLTDHPVLDDSNRLEAMTSGSLFLGSVAGVFCTKVGSRASPAECANQVTELVKGLRSFSYMIGIPLEQIAEENIAKLRERYPEKYSDEAAEARADKNGEDARNS